MKLRVLSGMGLGLVFGCGAVTAQQVTGMGVFGDNIADPGNIPAYLENANASGAGPFDTNFPASPPYFGNRYSNGLVAAEYLARLLGVPEEAVNNVAVGNAFSAQLPVDLAGGALIGNGSAIPGPIGRGLFPLNETDVQSQVAQYLSTSGPLSRDDLMLLYASANDGALALNTIALLQLQGAQAAAIIEQGAVTNAINTAAAAETLIAAGARQIVFGGLPDIGLTPAAAAGGLSGVTAATAFSQITNQALVQEAIRLNAQTSAVVSVFDTYSLLTDIVNNPAKYGITNVTTPCLLDPACLSDPDSADQYLFWDEFFPTTTVHEISARAIADTVNAPKTLAAQAEIGRNSGQQFLDQLRPSGENGAYVRVAHNSLDRDGETFAFGYDASIQQVTLGLESGGEGWNGTLALGFDDGDIDYTGLVADFDFASRRLGARAGFSSDAWHMDLSLAHSEDDYDHIRRYTHVADQTAIGLTRGETITAEFSASRAFQTTFIRWTPRVAFGFAQSEVDGYVETGATALEQIVFSRESGGTFGEIGLDVRALPNQERTWTPFAGLSYRAFTGDADQQVRSALLTIPDVVRSFAIGAPDNERIEAHVGIHARLTDHFLFDVQVQGFDARASDGYSAALRLQYLW